MVLTQQPAICSPTTTPYGHNNKKRLLNVISEEENEEEEADVEYSGTLADAKIKSFDSYFQSCSMAFNIYSTFHNTFSTMNSYNFSLPKMQQLCWTQFTETGTENMYKNVFKRRKQSYTVEAEWGIFLQMEAMCLQRFGNLALSHYYLEKGKDVLLKVYFSENLSKEEEYKASYGLILLANNLFAHGSLKQCTHLLQNLNLSSKTDVEYSALNRFYERTCKGIQLLQNLLHADVQNLLEQSIAFLSLCGCPAAIVLQQVNNLLSSFQTKVDFTKESLLQLSFEIDSLSLSMRDTQVKNLKNAMGMPDAMKEIFGCTSRTVLWCMCMLTYKQCLHIWKDLNEDEEQTTETYFVEEYLKGQMQDYANKISKETNFKFFCFVPATVLPFILQGLQQHMESFETMRETDKMYYKMDKIALQILSERFVLPMETIAWSKLLHEYNF